MRKPRSRPPADETRPTRRSLVELTAAASREDDGALVMPVSSIAAASAAAPRLEDVTNTSALAAAPKQAKAPRVAKPANGPSPRPKISPDSGSTAEMFVEIAKEHQARALENIRLGLAAALDYAKDCARTPMPSDGGSPDVSAKTEDNKAGDNLRAAVGAAAEYRTEAIEIAKAHAATTLDYARELAEATTAAKCVELSSTLARKQCELMLKQAAALQSFARRVTKAGGSSENG